MVSWLEVQLLDQDGQGNYVTRPACVNMDNVLYFEKLRSLMLGRKIVRIVFVNDRSIDIEKPEDGYLEGYVKPV